MKPDEFIKHHGVKGMKWGVRRNRSRNRAGLTTFGKDPKRLSDTELNRRIKRLELEKRYRELNAPIKSIGSKYASDLLANSGKSAVGVAIGTGVSFIVGRALKKKFSGGE